jgi:sec-independent protein translocase protein TatB
MLDISWTEFLLIGVVALIVIGPKELPAVLRTLGQWTRKVRSMAADFQNQFQEAMREAEMADLKKDIDDITGGIKRFDPLKDVRADVEAAGKDIQSSLEQTPASVTPATGSAETAAATEIAAVSLPSEPAPAPAAEFPVAEAAADLGDANVVGAATGPVTKEAAEKAAGEFPASEAPSYAREKAVVAAAIGPVAPEGAETIAEPKRTGQGG